MSSLPPTQTIVYNQLKYGYVGELGSGAHTRIKFLQSAVNGKDLDSISLIESIRGSEKWKVRDLFQRDVDQTRVTSTIVPYFKDIHQVKFFNPLTLVLLPLKDDGEVDTNVPHVEKREVGPEGHRYLEFERKDLLKYSVHQVNPAYSKVEWNSERVKLVAIDGQHRLSALKLWSKEKGVKALDGWDIPVVILSAFKTNDNPADKPPSLLEVVRRTFVCINTRAEEVNEARKILLNDQETEAVCTQELVQASHDNDCTEPKDSVNLSKLPLMLFDWRGQVRWQDKASKEVPAAGSLISITEVYQWMKQYIFTDGREADRTLELNELDPPMSMGFKERGDLDHNDADRVRRQFNETVAPGLEHLLQSFNPFKSYISAVRKLEASLSKQNPSYVFAFEKLRFGSHADLGGKAAQEEANKAYDDIVEKLKALRSQQLDYLVDQDVGMRAVVYSFAELKMYRDKLDKKTHSWTEHAQWFVPKLNAVYEDGWFRAHEKLKKKHQTTLNHICFDPTGSIINYKVNDVPKALGALVALLIVRQAGTEFQKPTVKAEIWSGFGDSLASSLTKGYRKQVKSGEGKKFHGTPEQNAEKVRNRADALVALHLKSLAKLVWT
jgi:acyl-CoA-binding protein